MQAIFQFSHDYRGLSTAPRENSANIGRLFCSFAHDFFMKHHETKKNVFVIFSILGFSYDVVRQHCTFLLAFQDTCKMIVRTTGIHKHCCEGGGSCRTVQMCACSILLNNISLLLGSHGCAFLFASTKEALSKGLMAGRLSLGILAYSCTLCAKEERYALEFAAGFLFFLFLSWCNAPSTLDQPLYSYLSFMVCRRATRVARLCSSHRGTASYMYWAQRRGLRSNEKERTITKVWWVSGLETPWVVDGHRRASGGRHGPLLMSAHARLVIRDALPPCGISHLSISRCTTSRHRKEALSCHGRRFREG